MVKYIIYVFIFISPTLQAQDSLKIIGVPKWKLDRLLDVYFFDSPKCDTALNQAHEAIDSLKLALTEGQKLIELRTVERDLKVAEAYTLRKAISASQKIIKLAEEETKKAKKRSFRRGIVLGLVGGVLILLL